MGQVAVERQRCQELEHMAEQQLQTINQVYLADVQRLRAANSSLLEEVNLAGERLTRCQHEIEVREAMLQDGGSKLQSEIRSTGQ